nr:LAGLIDADG family homing endonuclease [Candidatus Woesearchaeota archaeon]
MQKRAVFPKDKQKEFILKIKKDLGLTWIKLAEKLKVNNSTLKRSYRYEVCSLPYPLFLDLCNLINWQPKRVEKEYDIKIVKLNPINNIPNNKGIFKKSRTKLPNTDIKFQNKPIKLNLSLINLSSVDIKKNLKLPSILTPDLAEEVGMHYGDGFLSDNKFEYRLKGNKNEQDYYDLFIKPLYKKLFNIELNIKEYETTYGFELYSKGFWEFKSKSLKISPGRKNNIRLSKLIKVNDIKILTSFIRGIFDTDGCVSFISRYGFKNYYPTISIALSSKDLIDGIEEILIMLGFNPCKYKNKNGYWYIYLYGYERFKRYQKLIGWNNPKNLRKIDKWKNSYGNLIKENGMVALI